MSGVNLDALSDEQVDALIAGCRVLRARRAPYMNADPIKAASSDQARSENDTATVEPDPPSAPADTG